jgi:hypothetical protein
MDRPTTFPYESQARAIELAAARIKSEYRDMPGLRLTAAQAQRLLGVDSVACALALEQLTRDKFLVRRSDGTFGH